MLLATNHRSSNGLPLSKQRRNLLTHAQFGGDPAHVVMGGDSAGAASVNLQLTAYGGRDDNLFHATAAESQSFAAIRTVDECQYQYDALVTRTSCVSANDTLACLRSLNATYLQTQDYNIPFPGASDFPLYMWGPVLDNDFVQDYTYAAYAKGAFVKLPAIYGDDSNGGTIFAYKNTSSIAQSDLFLKNQFPSLTLKQLATFNALYPKAEQFNGAGAYWRQLSNAYGEMRYMCPGLYCSNAYPKFGYNQTWNYLWNVIDPVDAADGLGVKHTVEVNAIWGPENVNGGAPASYSTTNAAIIPVVQAYWTSFIRSYDPNVHRLPGSPMWNVWTENGYQRLMFQTNNTQMEVVDAGLQARCSYLWSIGPALNQ